MVVAVVRCTGQMALPKSAPLVVVALSVQQRPTAPALLAHKVLRAAMPRPPSLAAQLVVVVVLVVREGISPEPQVVLVVRV